MGMDKYVVTVTRQFGSLGRPIAIKLAEMLDIPVYDRDIVEEAANRMNLSLQEASSYEENGHNNFLYMKTPLVGKSIELKEKLFETEKKIIIDLAQKESCIIVGRCSDYILRQQPRHMNVFIYAPFDARLKNCVEELGMELREAQKMIEDVDKARSAYHKRYTRFAPEALNYNHLMVDSSLLGEVGTAEMLADTIKKKFYE